MKNSRPLILFIMLAAATLRLIDLSGVPPGLEHDEVANWLIDREILLGRHGVYFEEAYGHEAGYHYLQAAAVALFGDHVLSLRLPSVFAALLGIAISYSLAKTLFGEMVALISAVLLAALFWPLFFSRLGVRAIALPAVSGFSAWFFWKGRIGHRTRSSLRHFALGGVLAGGSLYTYMAARAVPLIFGLFLVYLAIFHRPLIRCHWRGLALFWLCLVVVAAPLAYWLLTNPGAEYRISEINQPLNAMLGGNLRPVMENALKLIGFFGWRGDPLIRQNLPGRPVFDPLGATLFYVGLALALWRWRRPQVAFVLIWLAVSLSPSLVTADAPSSIRCINALVVVGIPVGLTIEKLVERRGLARLGLWGLVIWLLFVIGTTVYAFWRWQGEDEVQFVWQTALWEAAATLDADPSGGSVVVGGWTPHSMDPPSMELFLRRDDLQLRFVDPSRSLLLPQEGARMVHPAELSLDRSLAAELKRWGATTDERGAFTLTTLPAPGLGGLGEPVPFEGGTTFLGAEANTDEGESVFLTYWQAGGPVREPLRIFFHLVDSAGEISAQDDGLGAPAAHWQRDDLILNVHRVALPAGEYWLRVGLYNPKTGERLLAHGKDGLTNTLRLGRVTLP